MLKSLKWSTVSHLLFTHDGFRPMSLWVDFMPVDSEAYHHTLFDVAPGEHLLCTGRPHTWQTEKKQVIPSQVMLSLFRVPLMTGAVIWVGS